MIDKPTIHRGLIQAEVRQRNARGETNYFKARIGRTYLQILRENLFNVFNILLFVLLLIVLTSQDISLSCLLALVW